MEDVVERKPSRSSILKVKSKSPAIIDDPTSVKTRRVSFSNKNFVKPFASDQDENTIWDNTYEEQIDQTESTKSSDATPRGEADMAACSVMDTTCRSINDITIMSSKTMEFTCVCSSTRLSDTTLMELTNGAFERMEVTLHQENLQIENSVVGSGETLIEPVTTELVENPNKFSTKDLFTQCIYVNNDENMGNQAQCASVENTTQGNSTDLSLNRQSNTYTIHRFGSTYLVNGEDTKQTESNESTVDLKATNQEDKIAFLDDNKENQVPAPDKVCASVPDKENLHARAPFPILEDQRPLQPYTYTDVESEAKEQPTVPSSTLVHQSKSPKAYANVRDKENPPLTTPFPILEDPSLVSTEDCTVKGDAKQQFPGSFPILEDQTHAIARIHAIVEDKENRPLTAPFSILEDPSLVSTGDCTEKGETKQQFPGPFPILENQTHATARLRTIVEDKENRPLTFPLAAPISPVSEEKANKKPPLVANVCSVIQHDKEDILVVADGNETEKVEVEHTIEADIECDVKDDSDGILQNDLSAEMLNASIPLNVQKPSPSNIVYTEKKHDVTPMALTPMTSFFVSDTSDMDTEGLINASVSKIENTLSSSSQLDFTIFCGDVINNLKEHCKIESKMFDRTEQNKTYREICDKFKKQEEVRRKNKEFLANFKLPDLSLLLNPEDDPESSSSGNRDSNVTQEDEQVKLDSSSSGTSSSENATMTDERKEEVVVEKTVVDKIKESFKRAKEGRWKLIEKKDDSYSFLALFKTVSIDVDLEPNTGIVSAFRTTSQVEDDGRPIFHYNAEVLIHKLHNLTSALGEKYDILSFLDYVHMSVDEVLLFNGEWTFAQIKYLKSHKLVMSRDYSVTVEVLNVEHAIWWIITLKLSATNLGACENVTASAVLPTVPAQEDSIRKVVDRVPPGIYFLTTFMEYLTIFESKFMKKLTAAKEAEIASKKFGCT